MRTTFSLGPTWLQGAAHLQPGWAAATWAITSLCSGVVVQAEPAGHQNIILPLKAHALPLVIVALLG